MLAAWLNLVGLLLNTAGGMLLFVWGPPPADYYTPKGLITFSSDEDLAADAGRAALRLKHQRRSKWGLGLVILGFVVQLVPAIQGILPHVS